MNKAKTDFTALINACKAAGAAGAKVATEVGKLLKSKRRSQADSIKSAAYAAFLGERKARDLPKDDKRTYDAMRTGFSRFYRSKKWTTAKSATSTGKGTEGFEFAISKHAKPEAVIKTVKTFAEWLRTEYKDEAMLKLAAFLADIE